MSFQNVQLREENKWKRARQSHEFYLSVYLSCDCWLGVHVNCSTVPAMFLCVCVCVCVSDLAPSGQGGGVYVRKKKTVLYMIMHASVCADLNQVSELVFHSRFSARRENWWNGHIP